MKKYFLLLLFLPVFTGVSAQTENCGAGLGFFIVEQQVSSPYYHTGKPQIHFAPSVYMRLVKNKNVFRLNIGNIQRDIGNFNDIYDGYHRGSSTYLNAGYQRLFLNGRFNFYPLADLKLVYSHNTGHLGGQSIEGMDFGIPPVLQYNERVAEIGMASGMGLRYVLFKHCVLTYEATIDLTVNKNTDLHFALVPVSLLALGYRF